jgi:alanyl-tRNA synthetase
LYQDSYPEINDAKDRIIDVLVREEKIFRQTLRKGLAVFSATLASGKNVSGEDIFKLYDTYGFPAELSKEEAYKHDVAIDGNADSEFERLMDEQRDRSRTATKGEFKGGLGGQTLQHKKYHTATHLMYEALRQTLGDHVIQHGSNINEERLRFDFSHPDKMTPEQIKQVEDIVNQQIERDLKVSFEEHPTSEAINDLHVLGAFGDRYGDVVKVYRMQADNDKEPFSLEICGGPHVDRTGQLAEDNKKFKIIKEESSSAGIRRIKAVLQ